MIVGNFRTRVGYAGKQSGFANIGEAHQSHICNYLQFQSNPELVTWLSWLCILWSLHGRSGKVHVAKTAFSAPQNCFSFIFTGHVSDYLTGFKVLDYSTFRNLNDQILGICTVASLLSALFSIFCCIFPYMSEIRQSVQARIHFKNNVSALSAVPTVGAACRNK